MIHSPNSFHYPPAGRRDFLSWIGNGLGSAALIHLLGRDGALRSAEVPGEASNPPPHHEPKARRAIHIFMCGGLSHVDSFDYKPELTKHHGKSLQTNERPDVFFGKVGLLHKNFWEFKPRGKSGLWVSELFPHTAEIADELTFIHSMAAETSNHTPATFQANSGFRLNGFPVLGSWLSFGMGSETDDLPAYIVLPDPRGLPAGGSINWTNGFLPARHQGVAFQTKGTPIHNLRPARKISAATDLASQELIAAMNRDHLQQRAGNDVLEARVRSYEMAARMQVAVPEVSDLESEPPEIAELYGLHEERTAETARQCLLARRLIERGVRFVQIFAGGAFGRPRNNWDSHENVVEGHGREAGRLDRPLAALVQDMKRRGLLDDTLLLCTSEFGRTPFSQSADDALGAGRDHSQYGFTVFLAGPGLKKGHAFGTTDDVGYKAVENPVTWYDFHATVLHLLGIDHKRLTFYHNGIQRRLTNVHGHVIDGVLA